MILNKKSPLLYKLQGRACIRGTTLIITKCDIFISINAASRLYVLLFPKRYSGTASQPVSRVFPPTTPLYKTLDSYYFPSQYLDLLFIVLTNFCLDLIHIYYNKKIIFQYFLLILTPTFYDLTSDIIIPSILSQLFVTK